MKFHCNHCGEFEAEMDVFSRKWRAWDGERIDTVAIPKDSCPKCGRLCWEVLAYLYRKQASEVPQELQGVNDDEVQA